MGEGRSGHRQGACRPLPLAPSVAVMSPPAGAQIQRGTNVTLQATASDTGSGVARVVFAVDGAQLGTDTTAPYQYIWNTRKASWGQHTLTAIAFRPGRKLQHVADGDGVHHQVAAPPVCQCLDLIGRDRCSMQFHT